MALQMQELPEWLDRNDGEPLMKQQEDNTNVGIHAIVVGGQK